jgi:hypothetical protein
LTCHKSSISDDICRGVIFCVQWGEVSAGCSFCWYGWCHCSNFLFTGRGQGRIQDFKLGGAVKKIAPSGGRRENFWGISCEKSRFYAKKSYFSNFRGGARNFWGISCEKSRFYAQKNHIFSNFRGGARRVRPPPESAPAIHIYKLTLKLSFIWSWPLTSTNTMI